MKRVILLAILVGLLSSCSNREGIGGTNPFSSDGPSQVYQEIQKLIDAGVLPNLDTSTSLRGKEVDGIREDVLREIERRFKEKYKDRPDIYRALLLSAWRIQRIFEIDPTDKKQAKYFAKFMDISVECVVQAYKDYAIPYLEKKYGDRYPFVKNEQAAREYSEGLDEVFSDSRYIRAITFNTYERAKFYEKFNQALSGGVYGFKTVYRLSQAGIGACEFLERVKKEWEKTGNILKIDIDQLIEQIKREREEPSF